MKLFIVIVAMLAGVNSCRDSLEARAMNRSVIDHLKFSRCFHCGERRGHKVFYTSAGVTFICRICKHVSDCADMLTRLLESQDVDTIR